MKKLLILLAVMGIGIFYLLSDDEQDFEDEGELSRKKIKKSHFPKRENPAM